MQPKMNEWVRHGKAAFADIHLMQPWRPNPFTDLRCNISDVVIHRFKPQVFLDCGVTFQELRDRYGMGPELMGFLKYTPEDWVALGMDAAFLETLSDAHWDAIFGPRAARKDLIMRCSIQKYI
jgi:hypothetical protein